MTELLLILGLVTGVAAAGRSTWSPCGLSMLSTITPFGERSRGHRYGATAAWFVAGAAVGGATLGGVTSALAAVAAAGGAGRHPGVVAAVAATLAAVAAGLDAGVMGEILPLIRRQVDDGWLGQYRPWVYGAGFGWQIGVGLATYLMTAAVPLVVALGALSGSPLGAFGVCLAFGLARGLTVFLTARATTPARLRALHSGLDRAGAAVRWAVVAVLAGSAAVLVCSAAGLSGPVVAVPAGAVGLLAAVAGASAASRTDRGGAPQPGACPVPAGWAARATSDGHAVAPAAPTRA